MGYCSDTAYVIEFDTKENARCYFEAVTTEVIKSYDLQCTGRYVHFHHDSIKWDTYYAEVKELTKVYERSLEAQGCYGYVFKRFGEDRSDYEEYSAENEPHEAPWETIEESRSLSLNIADN